MGLDLFMYKSGEFLLFGTFLFVLVAAKKERSRCGMISFLRVFMNNSAGLCYSRVGIAADARCGS